MYDLIILDIHMAVMDGFETAHRLRQLARLNKIDLSNTRLVAFSALSEE
jgi:CheY-like chemotaxis protein